MNENILEDLKIDEKTLPIISRLGELLPGGFFLYHAFGTQELIGFNSKMVRLFGCDTDEEFRALVGNSFRGIVHPDEYEEIERSIRRQIAENADRIDHVKYRFIRRDGSVGMMDDYGHFSHSETLGDVYYVFVQDVSGQYEEEMEKERLAEQQRKELVTLLTGSESTYIVYHNTERFIILGQNRYLKEHYSEDKSFTESITRYIETDVYEPDRAIARKTLVLGSIAENLKDEEQFSYRFRDISSGIPRWYELKAARLSDVEILCSFSDVDDAVTSETIYEKLKENYFGLYYVSLDNGIAKIIRTGHPDLTGEVGSSSEYTKLIQTIASASKGETVDFLHKISSIEYLRERFREDDLAFYYYPSYIFEENRWISVTGRVLKRNADGMPELFGLGFSLMDAISSEREAVKAEALKNHMREDIQMIGGLAGEYYALYYYNMDEKIFDIYTLDKERFPQAAGMVEAGGEPVEILRRFGTSQLIHPDDRARFVDLDTAFVREKLAHSKKYSVPFRRIFNGEYQWAEMDFIKYEDYDEPANAIAIGFAERDLAIRSEKALSSAYDVLNRGYAPDEAIEKLLAIAGEFYSADRCYIFEDRKRKKTIDNTYEWCADGLEAKIDQRQGVPAEVYAGWYAQFERQGAFFVDAPDSEHRNPATEELQKPRGGGLVAAPIYAGEDIIGSIGVDHPKKAEHDVTVLQSIANVAYSLILERNERNRAADIVRDLKDQQRHIKAFGDMINAALWSMTIGEDHTPKAIYWSNEVRRMFGYEETEEDFPNVLESWSEILHPDDKETVLSDLRRGFHSTDTAGYAYDVQYRILRKNGEYRWYHAVARMEDVDGGDRRLYGIITDISAEKELEENHVKLAEALSMAQSASRAKTTFLNNMSHDIRTPMNAIIGYTGLAASHIDNSAQVQDYLGKIAQSSDHLLSLINDVLDMSRIESGKMSLDEKEEDLPEIIQGLRDIVQADIHARQHDFSIDIAALNDEAIICDKLRLNQVLLNILSNSIKYTAAGGTISMRITQKAVKPNGYATYEFRIKDNGMGMEPEFVETIFDPFTRVRSTTVSGIQGTGLGMSITKNIVDMMGGRIEIRSEPGKGTETTVTFDFLLAETHREGVELPEPDTAPCDRPDKVEEAASDETAGYEFTGKKLLLVEDNELNREIATEILEEDGFVVDHAEDGTVAVEKMKAAGPGDYDLILMDIQMPIMDGYEAARQIRAMKTKAAEIPMIAMTANAFEEDRKAALEAGMNEHIAKPIDVRKLKALLAQFLREVDPGMR